MNKLYRITNRHVQNYIEERGIYPVYEEEYVSYYERTSQLISVLESYQIEFIILPNRH